MVEVVEGGDASIQEAISQEQGTLVEPQVGQTFMAMPSGGLG
jgi:hypothetical protein